MDKELESLSIRVGAALLERKSMLACAESCTGAYAVKLVHKTRPNGEFASADTKSYLEWGAGPRASQNLILAAKCNALINGKYSPDIEDVKAVAAPILRHRIVRNFRAEAEGISSNEIIKRLV